jgi:hypothetical protein
MVQNYELSATAAGKNIELSGKEYTNFINAIRSIETRKLYSYCLVNFMKFASVSKVADLLSIEDGGNSNGNQKDIEQKLIDYAVYLRDVKKVAYSTRNGYLASPLCFYSINDVTLNKKTILRYLGETTRAHKDRAYTTEEISKLLSSSDLRLRSIVLLLASAGLRWRSYFVKGFKI